MVKIVVLSEYSTSAPTQLGTGRIKIEGGPLYVLARVQQLVDSSDCINLFTRTCIGQVHELFDSDLEQVAWLIQALDSRDYIDSEWCENGKNGIAACDAYRIRRTEVMAATNKPTKVEYFVKFAVSKTGKLVLLVSCHLS